MEASTMSATDQKPDNEPLRAYNGEGVTLLSPGAYESFVQSLDEPAEDMPLLASITADHSYHSISILK
jgi:outer membrane lipoprotein-sorting protein